MRASGAYFCGAGRHAGSPAASAAQAYPSNGGNVIGLPVVRLRPATQSPYAARLTPSSWDAVSYV